MEAQRHPETIGASGKGFVFLIESIACKIGAFV